MRASTKNPPPLAAGRASEAFCVTAEHSDDYQTLPKNQAPVLGLDIGHEADQGVLASRSASPAAISAARDLVFEGLVEAGSLAESYSRSLTEAAWRGDLSTVEVHLRQLRACVVTSIGIFKQLDGGEEKGGHS